MAANTSAMHILFFADPLYLMEYTYTLTDASETKTTVPNIISSMSELLTPLSLSLNGQDWIDCVRTVSDNRMLTIKSLIPG